MARTRAAWPTRGRGTQQELRGRRATPQRPGREGHRLGLRDRVELFDSSPWSLLIHPASSCAVAWPVSSRSFTHTDAALPSSGEFQKAQSGRVPKSAVGPTDGASAFSHSLPTPPASSSPNKVNDGHVEDVLMKARSLCLLYSPRDTVLRLGEGSPSGAFDSCSRGCLCASCGEGTTAARRTRGEVAAVQV